MSGQWFVKTKKGKCVPIADESDKKVQTTPSVPLPVVADATAPPIVPTATASSVSVSEEVKSEEVGGTNIADLNTATA